MRMLDVNILVQAHREDADKHLEVRALVGKSYGGATGCGGYRSCA